MSATGKTVEDLWRWRESMSFAAKSIDLSGYEVVGKDGPIGTVDSASNDVRVNYVVVDAGDWLDRRQVMLPAGTVERVDPSARTVHLDRTREQVRDAPAFDPASRRSASFQDALAGYYHGLYDTGL
ncbi:MAG TPA: hypothetical protein VM433_14405 [Mycobacteriales bacterium]|nr:hypothetical protein [Mycobacteriales bacterium]